ncbi:MAG TPA: nitrate/sulfonate/bicarbonate ABC transporter ATP-binding protein [Caldimonas sp.]|nr:nitrate/sulfonate/bicarbonate ABC transporter ATP-binding protein [Caldimonas sp.]
MQLIVEGVGHRYGDIVALEGIDLSVREGEILALIGPSGCGKSTLLGIMGGILAPSAGRVLLAGTPPADSLNPLTYIFQDFALLPWRTVAGNVALVLEHHPLSAHERAARVADVLARTGLSEFRAAFPKQLSGGMRQRVGIARALVTEPDVLLMDEAFSALDVLTGETLRTEILELWDGGRIPTKGILVVSHNIEEAVMMADRVVILSSDPGRVRDDYRIALARPRDVDSRDVRSRIDEVYGLMTQRPIVAPTAAVAPAEIDFRLPDTDLDRIEAIVDLLAAPPFNGRADLPHLADEAELADEELFPTYEALSLLGLAVVEKGDIALTPLGSGYAVAEHSVRQAIFGRQLLAQVPLAKRIREDLQTEPTGALSEERLLELLAERLDSEAAKRTLEILIEWGRYGEVFEYDYNAGMLMQPDATASTS